MICVWGLFGRVNQGDVRESNPYNEIHNLVS